MKRAFRLTLTAVAGLLAVQFTQAQGGALPLATRPLQYTGTAGMDAQGAVQLRTAPLQYSGIAGR